MSRDSRARYCTSSSSTAAPYRTTNWRPRRTTADPI